MNLQIATGIFGINETRGDQVQMASRRQTAQVRASFLGGGNVLFSRSDGQTVHVECRRLLDGKDMKTRSGF